MIDWVHRESYTSGAVLDRTIRTVSDRDLFGGLSEKSLFMIRFHPDAINNFADAVFKAFDARIVQGDPDAEPVGIRRGMRGECPDFEEET